MAATQRLSDWTTLRLGGPAPAWITAESEADVLAAAGTGERLLVLGGGSNLVVADEGVESTVLQMAVRGVAVRDLVDHVEVEVMAGEPWDPFVEQCVHEGWTGVEALSGIPGLVGSTPIQNVGAYGQEVAPSIALVRALDRHSGEVVELERSECDFAYRASRFKSETDRWIVLAVAFHLSRSRTGTVAYSELAKLLGVPQGAEANIDEIRAGVLFLRSRKGMVLDDADHDTWSAGSFFTNPVVDDATAERVDPECPRYAASNGVKISAAWLIESAGITKGFALPGSHAAVSGKHVLALTNRGGATTAELLALADTVRDRVRDAHGITLTREPVYVDR